MLLAATVPLVTATLVLPAVAPVTVRLQGLTRLGGLATTRPGFAARLSVKAMPSRLSDGFAFCTARVSVVRPVEAICDGEKLLESTGGIRLCTNSTALPVSPVSATGPVAETLPVVLRDVPTVALVTVTRIAQVWLGCSVAPVTLMKLFGETPPVKASPHGLKVDTTPLTAPGGAAATVMPAGKVSVTPTPVSVTSWLGLVRNRRSVVVPPALMRVGEKLFSINGGRMLPSTVSVALAAAPFAPLAVATVPVEFSPGPSVVLVTLTEISQAALTGMIAELTASDVLPATEPEVTMPPQALTRFGVAATDMPAGNASVNETPVCGTTLPAGLARRIVSRDTPPA